MKTRPLSFLHLYRSSFQESRVKCNNWNIFLVLRNFFSRPSIATLLLCTVPSSATLVSGCRGMCLRTPGALQSSPTWLHGKSGTNISPSPSPPHEFLRQIGSGWHLPELLWCLINLWDAWSCLNERRYRSGKVLIIIIISQKPFSLS